MSLYASAQPIKRSAADNLNIPKRQRLASGEFTDSGETRHSRALVGRRPGTPPADLYDGFGQSVAELLRRTPVRNQEAVMLKVYQQFLV